MKKIIFSLVLSIPVLSVSCESEKKGSEEITSEETINVKVQSEVSSLDSIYITESITDRVIATVPVNQPDSTFEYKINYPTTGTIRTINGAKQYLTTLTPGKKMTIVVKDSSITTNSTSDSLLNYLWHSNNNFIFENDGIIFGNSDKDSILKIFEEFRVKRDNIIEKASENLTEAESTLLKFQNRARINSFLFFYGRMINNLPPKDPFFRFTENIDSNSKWVKSNPQNLLYEFELEYLKKNDSLQSISSFKEFIEENTANEDLADFLQAVYLVNLIKHPQYWEKHEQLFNSEILKQETKEEENNKYYSLIDKSDDPFFSSREGEVAYNFTAERPNGEQVSLSEYAGKVIFIDNWATWCGPCISHRPDVLDLARKYEDNPNVVVLMISMDAEKKNWLNFLRRNEEEENYGLDLIIEDGMSKGYGEKFNVNFIPKYILIGQNGKIIDANISEPSLAVERMIAEELNN